ncbi:hypothetical protein ILUMI_00737 [Ignelater luminosus]|uniref:Fibronectin type III domain-containing protein n=1 Tax=Ignelater luminosus TaxID=2038154 RepID=A0A8K0DLC2_IGNLU|nr:hypothetical protein ILUMI_00737 [Ignelater luminosus]
MYASKIPTADAGERGHYVGGLDLGSAMFEKGLEYSLDCLEDNYPHSPSFPANKIEKFEQACRPKCRWTSNTTEREPRVHSKPRRQRPRTNSAIFISNSGPGFDSKEFMRRYGSISKLCRKARSVDNISLEEGKHFGLPTLSVSGPSPPADEDGSETESYESDFQN